MAVMDILKYGDEFLRRTMTPVAEPEASLRQIAEDMGASMYAANGLGLAAPQVGLDMRLLVLDVVQVDEKTKVKKKDTRLLQTFINPEILEESDEYGPYEEGCLSIPGINADVLRPVRVKVRYCDLDFREQVVDADGLLARVLQHEIDHLNGVLFIDHLSRAKRLTLAGKLHKLKRETQARVALR